MKGLIVSIIIFAAYVVFTILVSHFRRIKRHGRLFFRSIALWAPTYFILYCASPANFWFLPNAWLGVPVWLELCYGFLVYLLNCHSYIDFFFGFPGGFSMSLMHDILLAGEKGRTTGELIAGFQTGCEEDKAYQRRIPHLAEAGMIKTEGSEQLCRATERGRRWAAILTFFKNLLNLSKGG